jgi:DNA-binding LytR/AlgR family response regulator
MIRQLKEENNLLTKENLSLQHRLNDATGHLRSEMIELHSADTSEVLRLSVTDIVLVKSADNYVEIFFRSNDALKKKLIRNTLKNIEDLLVTYPLFVRCHRTCIISMEYVERFQFKINDSYLTLKDLTERIPVSRQYVVRLREAMEAHKG